MQKGTQRYQHPTLGEIWIAKGSVGYELLASKNKKALDEHIELCWKNSGMTRPGSVSQQACVNTQQQG